MTDFPFEHSRNPSGFIVLGGLSIDPYQPAQTLLDVTPDALQLHPAAIVSHQTHVLIGLQDSEFGE